MSLKYRPRLRTLVMALVLAGTAISLAACGAAGTPAAASSNQTLAVGAYPGNTITWWPPIPTAAECGTNTGVAGMYLPVLYFNSADQVAFGNHSLASGLTVTGHDTQFTITLNPKWHWSNGTPVTASDVVYYYRLIKASTAKGSPWTYCYLGTGGFPTLWKSVTAAGSHTVVVTTTTPTSPSWFEHNGLSLLGAVPKATWDKYSNMTQELTWINKIGSSWNNPVYQVIDGPYRPLKVVSSQYAEFAANPRFNGTPKPVYKRVLENYYTSDASELLALKKGELNIDQYVTPDTVPTVDKLSNYRVVQEPSWGYYYVQMNFRSNAGGIGGLLNQLYIRQALQLGINQRAIVSAVYHGAAVPTYGPVPYTPKNTFYNYAQKNPYPYNPSRGKALLEQHGWRLVHGVMEKNGQALAFPFLVQSGGTSTTFAEILQAAWAKEGIKVSLVTQSIDTLYSVIGNPADSSKWAMAGGTLFGWLYIPDYEPSGDGLFNTGAGFNLGAYNSSTMNRLITLTEAAGSAKQVKQRFFNYESYAATNLPVLYVPTPTIPIAVSTNVKGFAAGWNSIESGIPWNYLSPK